jgi:predicted dehydrogenase
MPMLYLGIIGCGRVTSMFHLRAIDQIDDIRVVAVSDVSEERMDDIRGASGASESYLDYKKLLSDENVEAVAINTPPQFHETIVIEALKAGKHVLCEKPLAETIEGCIRIKETQGETGLIVLPAHNYAFTPSLVEMSKRVKGDIIGDVTGIDISFENLLKSYRSQTDFRVNTENGIVEDVLPHILSVVHSIVGHVADVEHVNWWCKDYEVCDNMKAEFSTFAGVPVNASMSWTKLRPRFSVTVNGSKGGLYTDLMINPYKLEMSAEGEKTQWKEKGVKWYLDLVRFKHPSFKNQYQHFYELIKVGCTPLITVDNEINILETMNKVSEKMGL